MTTLIRNVRVILPTEILYGHSLVINNGKIDNIISDECLKNLEFDNIINGEGNYLSPGFIDIHTHGNSGFDILDGTVEALNTISDYNMKNGVTSYLGTIITSSFEDTSKAINNINSYINRFKPSVILGVHLEGPFFNIEKKGAQPEKFIRKPDLGLMKKLISEANELVRMVSIAPELEGATDIVKYLCDKGITASLAHTNANYNEAKNGINSGITVATHLFNGMRQFTHREPGVVGVALLDDRVYCEIISDRVHLHDATIQLTLKLKGYDKVILVSDSMKATGLEDGKYFFGGQSVTVENDIAKLESGNLAGSTTNLRKSVYNMIHHLNIPVFEAVKMASLNPAKAINIHNNKGSIEIGKDADLIIFDEDVRVMMTFIYGNRY